MLHTFVALVQDKPGVLTRVASLFRRLNINIVSLTVGESERADTSRMTIVCEAPEHAAHRIRASLYKLEITVDVDEVGRSEAVILEMTGSSSKIEGLIQVLRESNYTILEVSRTGRMAMRRGHHTSRVLKALGTNGPVEPTSADFAKLQTKEIIPNEFADVHEEEEDDHGSHG